MCQVPPPREFFDPFFFARVRLPKKGHARCPSFSETATTRSCSGAARDKRSEADLRRGGQSPPSPGHTVPMVFLSHCAMISSTNNDESIVAYDLTDAKFQERSEFPIPSSRHDDTYPDKWKTDFREIWKLASPLKVHIKAGQQLYVGGKDTVAAVHIPLRGETPQLTWQANVQGTPHRILAADEKLFVITREGAICAFGGQKKDAPIQYAAPTAAAPPPDEWTRTAADILATTKISDGYVVVLGIGSGRLMEELIRQSKLDVIAVDADAGQVDRLRTRLHRAGLYGTRASVHVGNPLSYPLPHHRPTCPRRSSSRGGRRQARPDRPHLDGRRHPACTVLAQLGCRANQTLHR